MKALVGTEHAPNAATRLLNTEQIAMRLVADITLRQLVLGVEFTAKDIARLFVYRATLNILLRLYLGSAVPVTMT